jgi:hypothetical protein
MKELDDYLSGVHSPTIAEISVLVREVRVSVGVLTTPVTIRIFYDGRNDVPYRYELSAAMQTAPDAARRYNGRAPTEADALRMAIRMLTSGYEEAVRQGKMPDDSWLVAAGR